MATAEGKGKTGKRGTDDVRSGESCQYKRGDGHMPLLNAQNLEKIQHPEQCLTETVNLT